MPEETVFEKVERMIAGNALQSDPGSDQSYVLKLYHFSGPFVTQSSGSLRLSNLYPNISRAEPDPSHSGEKM